MSRTATDSWMLRPLGEVADVVSGYAFKSSDFGEFGIPVVKIKNVRVGYIDIADADCVDEGFLCIPERYHVSAGDVLISLTGSHISQPNSVVGRVARHSAGLPKCLLNQRVGKVIVKDHSACDLAFLFYALSERETMRSIALKAHGAASQANVSPSQIESVPIRFPRLPEQRRIVGILSAYDNLIEINRRRISLLEEMARRLFEEWFVHFRFPGHEGLAIVKEAETLLPKGWRRGVLGDLIRLAYGRALKADARTPGGVPVIGSSGIVGWHNDAMVKGPGIVVGRKGNVGTIIWSQSDFHPIDTVFFVESQYPLLFVLHQLQRLTFLNSDAAVPGLNRNAALSIPLTIPSTQLMEDYSKKVAPLLDLGERLRSSNSLLLASRDLLLPSLISGELSICAGERELEAVA
jgi:type I restriction enzyme, S subunit